MRRDLVITSNFTSRDSRSFVDFLRDAKDSKPLGINEEVELATAARAGDLKAREQLINGNIRFLISVAKQYVGQGIPLDDLLQEGYLGMLHAAELFDPSRGFKFISFAVWWVRQSIELYISENARTIRLPQNKLASIRRIRKISAHFEQENCRQPDPQEIASILSRREPDVTASQVASLQAASSHVVSADMPLTDDVDATTLIERFSSSSSTDAELMHESLIQTIDMALGMLPHAEADIIRESFGIGCAESSLEEIAARRNLSRERVRQIRQKGIRRLAEGPQAKLLAGFLM